MSTSKRILAVASGGGHWVQLLRLRPAFEGHHVTYVTVRDSYRDDIPGERLRVVADATRWSRIGLVKLAMGMLWIVLTERPDVVITTGAAPGYFAIRFARLLGARTLWMDSIANVEQLSMTGQLVSRHAHVRLTQWSHLAAPAGKGESEVQYAGAVL